MRRLDFVLPEWTRVIWASSQAREVWEVRMQRASAAWMEIERLSVLERARAACLQSAPPDRLPALSAWATEHGLTVLPLGQQGRAPCYAAAGVPFEAGKPWEYRVAIVRFEQAAAWQRAWKKGDEPVLGRMLGYPACCQAFFHLVWVEEGGLDTS